MKTNILLGIVAVMIFALVLGLEARGEPPTDQAAAPLIRIISASWCTPCQVLKRNLMAQGYLATAGPNVLRGILPLSVDGKQVMAKIEDIENPEEISGDERKALTPALDIRRVEYFPTIQLYVGGRLRHAEAGINSDNPVGGLRLESQNALEDVKTYS